MNEIGTLSRNDISVKEPTISQIWELKGQNQKKNRGIRPLKLYQYTISAISAINSLILIVCYGKLQSLITGYRTNRLLPLRKYSAQHRSQIFIGHSCRCLHWDYACSLLRSAVIRGCRGIRQQWAISHITSITMLSFAICLCAITSTIMGMFSKDKSFANNKKIGSRLVADFAVYTSKTCYI